MTHVELKQVLTEIETTRIALVRTKETAQAIVRRLAPLPDTAVYTKVFEEIQNNAQYGENEIAEIVFSLDIRLLNEIFQVNGKTQPALS